MINLGPGEVGLLIVYLFQLFDLFQWGVVLGVFVETLVIHRNPKLELDKLDDQFLIKS